MRLLTTYMVKLLLVCSAVTLTEGLYFMCKDVGDEPWKMVPKAQLCGTSCDLKLGDPNTSPDPASEKTLFCPVSNRTSCESIKNICQKCQNIGDDSATCYQAAADCVDDTATCGSNEISCGTSSPNQCISTETLKAACAKVTTSLPTTNVSRFTVPMGVMIAFILLTAIIGILAALATVVPVLMR